MDLQAGTLFPGLQYVDAYAAIDWFCTVLGFERKLVVPGEDKTVIHAQLTLGAGMIMLSSRSDTEFGQHMAVPKEIGGKLTQSSLIYIKEEDIEKHYQIAKEGGAQIIAELRVEDYGGRYYAVKDPEGHLWSISSYNPYSEVNS